MRRYEWFDRRWPAWKFWLRMWITGHRPTMPTCIVGGLYEVRYR